MAEYIYGKNAVYEYVKNFQDIKEIYIQNNFNPNKKIDKNDKINKIIEIVKKNNIKINFVDKKDLDKISENQKHQGVVLVYEEYKYFSLEEIINLSNKEENALIVILDGITDPHNLGAIIRTAEAAGVLSVIIPKHRSASVNHTVHKTSAGATSFMKVSKVTNINNAIDKLKDNGYWIYGADGYAHNFYTEINYPKKVCIVIGNEGNGISRLTKVKCDELIKIPMIGKTESLNASISAGIIMYEVINQKLRG